MNTTNKKDVFDRIMMLPLLKKYDPLFQKHKAVLLYILFGGFTTVVSLASFVLCESFLNINELIANVISWVCAVTFAYVTNRTWVFHSKATGTGIMREMLAFYGGRVASLGVEEALLFIFVTVLQLNSIVIKTIAQFAVLVLNYFISKLIVFRGAKK